MNKLSLFGALDGLSDAFRSHRQYKSACEVYRQVVKYYDDPALKREHALDSRNEAEVFLAFGETQQLAGEVY